MKLVLCCLGSLLLYAGAIYTGDACAAGSSFSEGWAHARFFGTIFVVLTFPVVATMKMRMAPRSVMRRCEGSPRIRAPRRVHRNAESEYAGWSFSSRKWIWPRHVVAIEVSSLKRKDVV